MTCCARALGAPAVQRPPFRRPGIHPPLRRKTLDVLSDEKRLTAPPQNTVTGEQEDSGSATFAPYAVIFSWQAPPVTSA
jgi:hypothetical protein